MQHATAEHVEFLKKHARLSWPVCVLANKRDLEEGGEGVVEKGGLRGRGRPRRMRARGKEGGGEGSGGLAGGKGGS